MTGSFVSHVSFVTATPLPPSLPFPTNKTKEETARRRGTTNELNEPNETSPRRTNKADRRPLSPAHIADLSREIQKPARTPNRIPR